MQRFDNSALTQLTEGEFSYCELGFKKSKLFPFDLGLSWMFHRYFFSKWSPFKGFTDVASNYTPHWLILSSGRTRSRCRMRLSQRDSISTESTQRERRFWDWPLHLKFQSFFVDSAEVESDSTLTQLTWSLTQRWLSWRTRNETSRQLSHCWMIKIATPDCRFGITKKIWGKSFNGSAHVQTCFLVLSDSRLQEMYVAGACMVWLGLGYLQCTHPDLDHFIQHTTLLAHIKCIKRFAVHQHDQCQTAWFYFC
jgi:hypothetical protein